MTEVVEVARWAIVAVLTILLLLTAVMGVPTVAFSHAVTDRDNVKGVVKQTGIYENLLDVAIEAVTEGEGQENLSVLVVELKNPESVLRGEIEKIINPGFIEDSTNTVIDAIYDWLEGKTDRPLFEIKIIDDEKTITNLITVIITERVRQLPPCPPGYEMPQNTSPLEVECLPEGIDVTMMERIIAENTNATGFKEIADSARLSSDRLQIDRKITENVRLVYNVMKNLTKIVAISIVVITILVILATPGHRRGFLIAGVTVLVASMILFAGRAVASARFDSLLNKMLTGVPNETLKTTIAGMAGVVYQNILQNIGTYSLWVMIYGVILIALGAIVRGGKS